MKLIATILLLSIFPMRGMEKFHKNFNYTNYNDLQNTVSIDLILLKKLIALACHHKSVVADREFHKFLEKTGEYCTPLPTENKCFEYSEQDIFVRLFTHLPICATLNELHKCIASDKCSFILHNFIENSYFEVNISPPFSEKNVSRTISTDAIKTNASNDKIDETFTNVMRPFTKRKLLGSP